MNDWQEKLPSKERVILALKGVFTNFPLLSESHCDDRGVFKAADKYGNIYLVELRGPATCDSQGRYHYSRRTMKKLTLNEAEIQSEMIPGEQAPRGPTQGRFNF